MEECLNTVPHKVTSKMQKYLSRDYSADEIKATLFQMRPTKVPGLDGMNALFYQNCWHIVGDDVTAVVLDFLNSSLMLPKINYTDIVLIPKIKLLKRISDYRPISLSNVIYKIISKVLTNKLKIILPHLISQSQSAFVPRRLITDNVLVAYESLHSIHNKRSGNKGSLALKLDFSKAYDRVEWDFLKRIMSNLGLRDMQVEWVMCCVTTSSFSVRINGKAYGNIRPIRGLCQGDPPSLYLFLLCAEGFSSLLAKTQEE